MAAELYKNPDWFEENSDLYWEDSEISKWCNSAQYTIIDILHEYGIMHPDNVEKYNKAYNLGKNLWSHGYSEETIREELQAFALNHE